MTDGKSLGTVIDEIIEALSALPDASRIIAIRTACQHLGIELSERSVLSGNPVTGSVSPSNVQHGGESKRQPNGTGGVIPTPSQVKVFMQKTGVTMDELRRIVIYEDGELHFVQEPTTQRIARGQIEWALLLALKNGITTNNFSVDPESVRSISQEKGFYDQGNFIKNFKTPKNSVFFQGPMDAQGEAQKLTTEGQKELGRVLKDLAAASS